MKEAGYSEEGIIWNESSSGSEEEDLER